VTLEQAKAKLQSISRWLKRVKNLGNGQIGMPRAFAKVERVRKALKIEKLKLIKIYGNEYAKLVKEKERSSELELLPIGTQKDISDVLIGYIYEKKRHTRLLQVEINNRLKKAKADNTQFKLQYERELRQYIKGQINITKIEKWKIENERIWAWNRNHPDLPPREIRPQPAKRIKPNSARYIKWQQANAKLDYYRYMRSEYGVSHPMSFKKWQPFRKLVWSEYFRIEEDRKKLVEMLNNDAENGAVRKRLEEVMGFTLPKGKKLTFKIRTNYQTFLEKHGLPTDPWNFFRAKLVR